jgi:Integrase core domain
MRRTSPRIQEWRKPIAARTAILANAKVLATLDEPEIEVTDHWFLTLDDARMKMENWRKYYNEVRPHGYPQPAQAERRPCSAWG